MQKTSGVNIIYFAERGGKYISKTKPFSSSSPLHVAHHSAGQNQPAFSFLFRFLSAGASQPPPPSKFRCYEPQAAFTAASGLKPSTSLPQSLRRTIQHNPRSQPPSRPPLSPLPRGTRRRSRPTYRRRPPQASLHPMARRLHGPPRLARCLLRLPKRQRSKPKRTPGPSPRQRSDAPSAGRHRFPRPHRATSF